MPMHGRHSIGISITFRCQPFQHGYVRMGMFLGCQETIALVSADMRQRVGQKGGLRGLLYFQQRHRIAEIALARAYEASSDKFLRNTLHVGLTRIFPREGDGGPGIVAPVYVGNLADDRYTVLHLYIEWLPEGAIALIRIVYGEIEQPRHGVVEGDLATGTVYHSPSNGDGSLPVAAVGGQISQIALCAFMERQAYGRGLCQVGRYVLDAGGVQDGRHILPFGFQERRCILLCSVC